MIMTHGDLHPRNIIVEGDSMHITGIVDWESGGGYPEYWEYVKALQTGFDEEAPDWHLSLPDAIVTYAEEYAKDLAIDRMVN